MKKSRILAIITVLCLCFCMIAVLSACGDDKTENEEPAIDNPTNTVPSGDIGNTNTGNNVNTNTGESGNTQNTDQGGENDQSSGNQGGATSTKTLPSTESIIAAIGTLYKVSAQDLYGSAPTTVAFDGTYEYISTTSVIFRKKIGDNLYAPYKQIRNGKYTAMGNTPTYYGEGALRSVLGSSNVKYILQFGGEEISYQKEEAVTFLNRPAKKYTFDSTNAYGYNISFHEEITIDDATGACLKYDGYGRAGDGFTGGTRNKNSFEVTVFQYGADNAEARAFMDEQIAKIDIYEWETSFIQAVGLSSVDAPRGELFYSMWYLDSGTVRNGDAPYWDAVYHLSSDTQEEYQSYIRDFCKSFYDAGAKIDSGTHQADFEDLYSNNGGWDDVNLTARVVGNEEYEVYVSAVYRSHRWNIEVSIRKCDD